MRRRQLDRHLLLPVQHGEGGLGNGLWAQVFGTPVAHLVAMVMALTLLSGVVLLLVFVLVGWYQRQRKEPRKPEEPGHGGRIEENRTRGRGARQ